MGQTERRPWTGAGSSLAYAKSADAKNEALARVEAATIAVSAMGARLRSAKLLKRALAAWKRGDTAKAAQLSLAATEADESHAQAFHLLAIMLEKLGHLHKALVTYTRAFELDPDDTDLLLNLGLTAWNIEALNGAEKMFRLFMEKRPDHPAGYNNLGGVQRDKGDLAGAIETLRGAIYRMPNEAMLWNSLGTALAEEGRSDESLVFYEEAIRLNPKLARVRHNLGYAYAHLGRDADALAAYDEALKSYENGIERIESRHSRSICLITMGRLEEGFKEYEIRHTPDFRAYTLHYTRAPLWRGEDLTGKRVLVVGEQGLGDEMMFANVLPDVARAVGASGKLQIAVDPRLIPIFQRSFPDAEVGLYDDGKLNDKPVRIFPWAVKNGDPDFYMPMGTPLAHFRTRVEDFPGQPFLKADPARVEAFRAQLNALSDKPKIGICWRSMVLGAKRRKYFSTIEDWASILANQNATFINLQYGDCRAELETARKKLGVTVHRFPDVDLRDDLDAAAALTASCDLVIAAPTAAAAMAGALGVETWFVMAGRAWPQLGTDHYPWYRKSRVFAAPKFADWKTLMPRLAEAVRDFTRP